MHIYTFCMHVIMWAVGPIGYLHPAEHLVSLEKNRKVVNMECMVDQGNILILMMGWES